jgi:hypothetical protein
MLKASNVKRCVSQIWNRVGSRGAPFKSDRWNDHCPTTHHHSEGDKSWIMKKDQVLNRLEKAWATFQESYAGLSNTQLMETGVMGDWSVKDILAHVTTWEEALSYLPLILT